MGFISDSPERLIERLPPDFADLRDSYFYVDRRQAAGSIADWISARLTSEHKSRWLFEVGRHMMALKNRRSSDEHIAHLQALLTYPPEDLKPQLIEFLERLIADPDSNAVDEEIKFFEGRLYYFGR